MVIKQVECPWSGFCWNVQPTFYCPVLRIIMQPFVTSTRTLTLRLFSQSGAQRGSSLISVLYFRAEIRGLIPSTSWRFSVRIHCDAPNRANFLAGLIWADAATATSNTIHFCPQREGGGLPQSTLDIVQVLLREQQLCHCEPQLLLIWATSQVCLNCNRLKILSTWSACRVMISKCDMATFSSGVPWVRMIAAPSNQSLAL